MLTSVKHDRDSLRGDNVERQQKGLSRSSSSITKRLDILKKKESSVMLQQRYEQITRQIAELKSAIAAAGGIV